MEQSIKSKIKVTLLEREGLISQRISWHWLYVRMEISKDLVKVLHIESVWHDTGMILKTQKQQKKGKAQKIEDLQSGKYRGFFFFFSLNVLSFNGKNYKFPVKPSLKIFFKKKSLVIITWYLWEIKF